MPPLHRVEVNGAGRREREVIYTYSDAELRRVTADLTKRGRTYKDPQRYKGLGEMDEDQLAETTMERAHRTLRRVTVSDGAVGRARLRAAHGQRRRPRKDFIIAGAENLDRDRIDACRDHHDAPRPARTRGVLRSGRLDVRLGPKC